MESRVYTGRITSPVVHAISTGPASYIDYTIQDKNQLSV